MQIFKFESFTAESSIFIDKKDIIIALYISDFLIFMKTESDIEQIKKLIKKMHIMKNMKEISKILKIHVIRKTSDIKIDQDHYIHQILTEFDMKKAKLTITLMNFSIKLDNQDSKVLSQQNHKLYCKIMKKLMFALIVIWIDIIITINKLSQYLSESWIIHLQAVKHILRYLCDLFQLKILYKTISDFIDYANAVYVNVR